MLLDRDATRQHRKEAERKEETTSRDTRAERLSKERGFYVDVYFITNLIEGAHPGDGADVVGDGDQRCSGQVFFGHRLPLLFGHHVAKTVRSKRVI